MKKIFTFLIFMVVGTAIFAQPTTPYFYYNGDAVSGEWTDTSGAPAAGPSATTAKNGYVVQTGTYRSTGGEKVLNLDIRVGANFEVTGKFAAYAWFKTHGPSSAVQVIINPESTLDLSGGQQVYLSKIAYVASSSVLIIGANPGTSTDFLKINPSASGYGTVVFTRNDEVYNCGNLIVDDQTIYKLEGTNITLVGDMVVAVNSIIGERDFTIQGGLQIVNNAKVVVDLQAIGTVITGDVIVEPGSAIVAAAFADNPTVYGTLDIEGHLSLLDAYQGRPGVAVGRGITCDDVSMKVKLNTNSKGSTLNKGDFWREMGIPFDIAIEDVQWGTKYHNEIVNNYPCEAGCSYIDFYDAPNYEWMQLPNNTKLMQGDDVIPFEVYMRGGEYIVVDGVNLHTNSYTHTLFMSKTIANDGWNFIVNPYTAYLNLHTVIGDNVSRLQGGYNTGGNVLVQFALSGSTGQGNEYRKIADSGSTFVDQIIAPFQGFWVQALTNGGIFRIKTGRESVYVPGFTFDLQKQSSVKEASKAVVLYLKGAVAEGFDGSAVFSFPEESIDLGNELWREDSRSMNWSPSNVGALYMNRGDSYLDAKEASLSTLNSNTFKEDLFFSYKSDKSFSFELMLDEDDVRKLDASYNIYVLDKFTNTTHKLNDGSYKFQYTPGDDFDRFEIQITTEALGDKEDLEISKVTLANKGNSIEFLMPETSSISNMTLVNVNGQVMQNVMATPGQTEFNISTLSKGIYVARLTLKSGVVTSFKFVH